MKNLIDKATNNPKCVDVTKDHINRATRNATSHPVGPCCPITLAMRIAGYHWPIVGKSISFMSDSMRLPDQIRFKCQPELKDWMHRFHQGISVEPITIEFDSIQWIARIMEGHPNTENREERVISVHVHAKSIFVSRPFDGYVYKTFHNGQEVHPNEYWFKDLEGIRVFLQKMGIPVSVIFNGMGILNRSFDRKEVI